MSEDPAQRRYANPGDWERAVNRLDGLPSRRRGANLCLGERLTGLGLTLFGCGVLIGLSLLQPHLMSSPLGLPPPGMASPFNPVGLLLPIIGLGAVGLVLVGLKRLLFPDP